MVIANSDSNTTLVSLNNDGVNGKHESIDGKIVVVGETGLLRYAEPSASTTQSLSSNVVDICCGDGGVPTELLISISDGSSSSAAEKHVPLYLPSHEQRPPSRQNQIELNVDEYISRKYHNIANVENERSNNSYQPDHSQTRSSLLPGAERLKESRDRLLASKHRRSRSEVPSEPERTLYVAQGERANATSDQYDVLMSDKATTCHIVAFRSTTNSTNDNGLPLTSLTHLDGPHYEECVRNMIKDHIDYHRLDNSNDINKRKRTKFTEEKKSEEDLQPNVGSSGSVRDEINIDVHVMGGFNDIDSSSSSITNWLMRLLTGIAQELKDQRAGVRMVMKTLVVSSSNNEVDCRKNDSPIGRGFGIHLLTGEVFLTENEDEISTGAEKGPVSVLRSVRLWSRNHRQPHRLSVVHTTGDVDELWTSFGIDEDDDMRKDYSLFWVQPFVFRSIPNVDRMLQLPDELLLQYTSTSPDVEEAGFCEDVRASYGFLNRSNTKNEKGSSYFGKSFDRPMVFAMRRHSSSSDNNPKLHDIRQREQWCQISL